MLNYKLNHQTTRFDVESDASSAGSQFLIKRAPLSSLHARLSTAGGGQIVPLSQSPHHQLLAGNARPYLAYLNGPGKASAARSIATFDQLLNTSDSYLSSAHATHYIVCEFIDDKCVIVDGLHRAAVLMHNQAERIPVALRIPSTEAVSQLEYYLRDYKDDFREWYTPIQIGNLTIQERTYPNFVERPEYLTNRERGQSKFDYIIRKNLPKLEGKTACDVGCNIGLFAYNLLQLGAKSVDGYDRSEEIVQPTNTQLPRQSVVQQAYFVKNLLQLNDGKTYPGLNFYERDINQIDFKTFKYDFFFSCCVLYHFGERFEGIIRDISSTSREVFLQANLGHSGALAQYASVGYHKALLEKYGYRVHIDAPDGYQYPVVFGTK